MDWPNERWVKWYTRQTPSWRMLPWQSRAIFGLLLKECDPAGQISLGRSGLDGLAAAVGLPIEVVRPGIEGLESDGAVTRRNAVLTVEQFVEAQEAKTSNKARQQALRDRRKAAKLQDTTVTQRNRASRSDESRVDESRREEKKPMSTASAVYAPGIPDPDPPIGQDQPRSQKQKPTEVEELIDLWNRTKPPELAGTRGFAKGKPTAEAASALREIPLAEWPAVIERLRSTPHCLGHGSTGWRATLAWLVHIHRETGILNATRVRDGALGGRANGATAPPIRGPTGYAQARSADFEPTKGHP